MAWTAEQMAQKRAKLQKKTNAAAGGAEPLSQRKSADSRNQLALGSTGNSVSDNSDPWTAEKMAEKRAALQTQKQQTGTDLYSTALEDYRTRNNLGFAEEQGGTGGTVMNSDLYAGVNNWKDSSDRNKKLAKLVTEKVPVELPDNAAEVDWNGTGAGVAPMQTRERTDAELLKMGYTQTEINRARNYMTAYGNLNPLEIAARRLGGTVKSVPKNVVGGVAMDAGALPQAMVASAEEQMIRRIQSGRYTDKQLEQAGYDPALVQKAHERIASGDTFDKATDESNPLKGVYEWGRDTHKEGERDLADAMAGESDTARFWHGAATSAAENLVLGSINPALVLPVLSAQGAGDSMAASDEKGESPEKALVKSGLKFGAGWAINSVGVADLAKTMGSDYAKDTLAGKLADAVRGLVGSAELTQKYPAIANAISGGADNAMQAFVETYADKAIDAVMGDQEAAKTLFNKDTFLTALESGLSGGASGALGGAVGTGLSRMNAGDSSLRGNVERYAAQDEYEQALKEHQRREELAREPGDGEEPLSQRSGADSSPTEGSPWQDGQDGQDGQGGQGGQGVLTAIKNDGREVFYDVVNIEPTKIKASDGTAEGNTSGSKSTETIGEAGESDAENADSNGKRHPTSPESIIQNTEAGVNDTAVENPGENVDYSDVETRIDPAELDGTAWNRDEQKQTARQLAANARMTTKAAQGVVDAMPEGIGAGIYARAANSLYQLGKMEDVTSFEQAVNLTGGMNSLGGAVRQVLALGKTGENALRIAYTYGQGEAEAYNARKTSEIGSGQGAVNPDAGTYFKGRNVSKGTNAMDAFIELGAKSSGTAIHRAVEGLQNNARGFIKAAAGEMYLSGEAGSETVMHETFHMLNEWSPETGQAVMDRLLTYLVQQNGMESTEKLVESYLGRYEDSGVKMTWNQALEEITADAMETVFGTADGFRNFVRQQAAEAKMNAKARGMIGKVMDKIDSLLHTVLADVNRFLKNEPTNAAAKAARSLTEQQLKDLQNLYFEHQAEAGSKYREVLTSQAQSASSPNRGAKEQGSAEVKYSIDPSYAQDIDEWNRDGRNSREIFVLGSTAEALQGLGARENDIYMKGDKISLILEQHPEMTLNEIKRIPEILDDPILVLSSRNKGRAGSQNTRLVLFGSVKAQDGRPVLCVLDLQPVENRIVIQDMQKATSAYTKDNDPVRFVRNSEVLYTSENKKRTTALLRTLGFQMPSELQRYGSMGSISYHGQNVKMKGVPFTEIETQTKYQLDVDSDAAEATRTAALGDVDKQTDLMRQVSELGGKVRLSDQSITDIVRAVLSDTGSKLDAKTFTERMRALSDYIALNKDVSWDDVYTFASDIAEQLMQRSSHKNDEMWKHYPELHQMSMVIEKGSKDYSEILYHWGSWANARKELARRGVKITQSKEGVHSHWDADFTELQKLGAGLFPTETPNSAVEALEAMAEAHDTIRPVMQNDYSEDWDGAKQDIAMQIMLRYMNSTEVANEQNAEARQEFTKQWEEMRKQAKQEALEARAKVELERAKREQALKEAAESAADPFRLEAAKANARADKAEAFARKQRESVSTTIRLAKDRAEKQLQKARDAREMDTTRRNINKMTSQLTQMLEKPSEKGYVPEYLLEKVRPVAALANDAVGNRKAAAQLRAELNGTYGPVPEGGNIREAVEGLSRGIDREVKLGDRAAMEWQQSRLPEQISDWLNDVNEAREIEMEKLRGEIENAEKWLKKDTPEKKAYIARLNADLKAYQDGNLATLTADQTRELSEILEKTLFIVKNENVMLGSIEDVMVDDFAEGISGELKSVRQQRKDTRFGKIFREVTSVYKLNTMNIERNFERLGGYNHGGCMEQLGRQLNEGQARKERIKAEGERIFSNVTGPEHAEELYHFTHDLVDIGLKTRDGKPWLVTHDVMTELWVQLQNRQGLHHLLYGGATIADMSFSTKGLAGLGEQYSETVTLGELVTIDKDGSKLNAYEISKREDTLRTSILGEIEKNLTAYDDLWISDFRELGKLTKGYINEASMTLYGVKRARVENYIHMNVDRNTLVEQNEGVRRDVSVGSEGYMKTRQNSSKPLALVGLVKQASESIENAAQFAGMAIPLRNAEKVLNSMQGGETQYGAIERSWGRAGRKYMQKAMADLSGSKGDSEVFDHLSSVLRGNAAAAVLTGNLNVTLLQAASLPTAAAELGWGGTGASAVQFVMNLKPSQLNSIVERAYRFGDSLLPTRLRGSSRGELSNAAKEQGVFSTAHDGARNSQNVVLRYGTRAVNALADFAGGSIGWMDKVTVASLFHGAENYVQKNLAEYDLTKADLPTKTMEDGSKAYQEAVMSKFRRVVERTQPNYTVMQRTGMQRSKNQMLKTLSMFSTQRQQNAQIMVSAVEDLAAQWQRNDQAKAALEKAKAENDAPRLAECKAAAEKAKADRAEALKRFWDAAISQIVQTAVIAGLGILVKFILHRWDDLQDENGDMTLASLGGSFLYQFSNSVVSNYTGGSELWTAAESIHSKRVFGNYDSVSMTGFSAINDAVTSMTKLNALLDKDTGEMTEKEMDDYADSVKWAWADTAGQLMMLVGVPYNNGKKYVQAVFAWMDTVKQWDETGEKNFNSTPDSATGQYDRLFEAIQTGNTEEVQAATKKLERMLAEGKIKELKTDDRLKARLKKYDEDILDAARAKNAGDLEARKDAKQEVYDRLCTAYGVKKLGEKGETDEDKAQRARFRELIDKAVNEKADSLLAGDKDRTVYSDLTDALETGKRKDVQDEIDRLRTAGKDDGSIKTKITAAVKEEYLAGNDHDREKLEKLLTSLTKEDGTAMYEEKNFAQWVKDAAKKEEQEKNSKDEWAGVR